MKAPSPRRWAAPRLRAVLVRLACAWACVACAAAPPRPTPVAGAAARAFAEARTIEREGGLTDRERRAAARAAAERAVALDPTWVGPRRFLDDLDRADLVGPELLSRYDRALARHPDDPDLLYLWGRLRGARGEGPFAAATRRDAGHAWAWHGRGVLAGAAGKGSTALRDAERALDLARSAHDRATFARALASQLAAADRKDDAIALLDRVRVEIARDPGGAVEADGLEVAQAIAEMRSSDEVVRERGGARATALVRTGRATPREWLQLYEGAQAIPWGVSAQVRLALLRRAAAGDDVPEVLLEELVDDRVARTLGLDPGESLAGAFARGEVLGPLEAWRASLPRVVLDADGLPRDPRLARVLAAAGDYARGGEATAARAFGLALLDVGWFSEAFGFAQSVPGGDARLAVELLARAEAGRQALRAMADLVRDVDRGKARRAPSLDLSEEPRTVRSLDELLGALSEPLSLVLGDGTPEARLALEQQLVASPRLRYGFAGQVVHPGPRFSALDEELGLGARGTAVGGLAEVCARIGRFALFGDALGSPPDGTLLRRLWVEERRGEHLGVPFAGTVAWCEGADFGGRATRAGATIAGAALHEGYWVDLAPLRDEVDAWSALAERFSGTDGATLVERALTVRPLPCAREDRAAPHEWAGEADRVRLAVMRERAGAAGGLAPPDLDELAHVTAVHEEGHLCDRTRFFPVGRHWRALLSFLMSNRFSPALLSRRLEERAQIVCLAEAVDPRLPLADVLDAAESGGSGLTPHADAYAAVAEELLQELDAVVDEVPGWGGIDPDARLVHQMHVLSPEEVRELAVRLARRRGLTARR